MEKRFFFFFLDLPQKFFEEETVDILMFSSVLNW